MSPALPLDVERFLVDHIDSIAQLEILHLLHQERAAPQSAAAVARALGVDPAWAAAELENLTNRGFLAAARNGSAPEFRFGPRSADLEHIVDETLRTFRERRVTVINFVASKPSRHIRGFADAFRLRKD